MPADKQVLLRYQVLNKSIRIETMAENGLLYLVFREFCTEKAYLGAYDNGGKDVGKMAVRMSPVCHKLVGERYKV